jgi:hypothetical protein
MQELLPIQRRLCWLGALRAFQYMKDTAPRLALTRKLKTNDAMYVVPYQKNAAFCAERSHGQNQSMYGKAVRLDTHSKPSFFHTSISKNNQ